MISSVSQGLQAVNAYSRVTPATDKVAQQTSSEDQELLQKQAKKEEQSLNTEQSSQFNYESKEVPKLEIPERDIPRKDVILVSAEEILRPSETTTQAYTPQGNKNPNAVGISGINIDTTA